MRNLNGLINDLSKYCILICFMLCSIFILVVVATMIRFVFFIENRSQDIAKMLVSIDALINCVCLISQFGFVLAKKCYKLLCNQCHLACVNRYTNQ